MSLMWQYRPRMLTQTADANKKASQGVKASTYRSHPALASSVAAEAAKAGKSASEVGEAAANAAKVAGGSVEDAETARKNATSMVVKNAAAVAAQTLLLSLRKKLKKKGKLRLMSRLLPSAGGSSADVVDVVTQTADAKQKQKEKTRPK
eukprot:TRINITY_DN14468_c0_g1_i13.p1 TRINITY_DN14468_c0_g1~~TRINITY_DN14468_c0_g1_i13.p1  ORF type:complete len:149 (-),score=35.80 TRINITY_DN14468_c0_g1_i13:271-717(-)